MQLTLLCLVGELQWLPTRRHSIVVIIVLPFMAHSGSRIHVPGLVLTLLQYMSVAKHVAL